jgi:hypothetical protein
MLCLVCAIARAASVAVDYFNGTTFSQVDVTTGTNALLGFDGTGQPTKITAGTGISISGGVLTATGGGGGSGTVTSVSGSGGTTGLTLTGGPITDSGTLTLGGTLALANGGTGATTGAGARTALGLAIGTDVQAYSASTSLLGASIDLTTEITGTLALANGGTGATTAAGARTALELGSLAVQSGTFSGTFSGTSSGTNTGDQDLSVYAPLASPSFTGQIVADGDIQGRVGGATRYSDGMVRFFGGANASPWHGGLGGSLLLQGADADAQHGGNGGTLAMYGTPGQNAGSITTIAGGSLTMGTGDLAGGNVAGTILTTDGNGSSLTNLSASNVTTGTLALANGGTGAALTDPNADRIAFWDDSAGAVTWLTAGSGLTISGTTITASGGGGGGSGTVTSVSGSGGTTGLTLTGGPITDSGTLTIGGTLALANGGTGATTASAARTAIGLAIGTDVQAYSASTSLLGSSIDLSTEITGTLALANGGTGATTASAARTALGLVIGTDVQAYSASTSLLGSAIDLSTEITGTLALANGGTGAALTDPNADRIAFWDDSAGAITWLTVGSGLTITGTTIAASGGGSGTVTSISGSGGTTGLTLTGGPITDSGTLTLGGTLALANGGTGSTTASAARTALGLVIGTDVQAYSASTSLLGSAIDLSTEITGTLALANGGTNATTASAARTALGLAIGTDVQAYSASTSLLGSAIDLSTEITGTLALANGGTGAALTDPNADRIGFWDDSAGTFTWLTLGSGLSITGTTITATGGGGGSAPQPVQAVLTTTATTTSTTYADITGLTASYTPTSTTQKVLVRGSVSFGSTSSNQTVFRLARGGSALTVATTSGSRTVSHVGFLDLGNGLGMETATFEFLDTPGTTSSVTYSIQWKRGGSSGTCYLNRAQDDLDYDTRTNTVSTLTIIPFAD